MLRVCIFFKTSARVMLGISKMKRSEGDMDELPDAAFSSLSNDTIVSRYGRVPR